MKYNKIEWPKGKKVRADYKVVLSGLLFLLAFFYIVDLVITTVISKLY